MKVAAIMEVAHRHQAPGHHRHIHKLEVAVTVEALTVAHLTAAHPLPLV